MGTNRPTRGDGAVSPRRIVLLQESSLLQHAPMQTVNLVGGDVGWHSYKGIVTVGVAGEGILLRVMLPFSFFHPPLLIPFGDTQIKPRKWYLIGKTAELTLREVGNVQVIIHDELLQWIASQTASLASLTFVPEHESIVGNALTT